MDFLEIMKSRRSCRAYQGGKTIPREDLLKIIEAGRLTPSGCNAQPWKFIVVDSPEAKSKLCDAIVVNGGVTGAPWRENVSAFIILVEQKADVKPMVLDYYHDSQRFAQGDIGAACMNMCIEAHCLGIANCIIGMNDQEKMERYFGIPSGSAVRMVLALGYAVNDHAPAKIRKGLDEVCSFNYWK